MHILDCNNSTFRLIRSIVSVILALTMVFGVLPPIKVSAASELTITAPEDEGAISKSNFTYVKWNSVSGAAGYRITIVDGNTGKLYTSESHLWVGNKKKYSIRDILDELSENAYPLISILVEAMSTSDNYNEDDVISDDIVWTTVAEAPLIENGDASDIGPDCVTLDMEIIRNYGISVTEAGFYIGTSSNVDNADKYSFEDDEIKESKGTYTLDITDLEPDTKYYYWAYAVNDVDETKSVRSYFYTKECTHNRTDLSAAYEQVNPLNDTYHERIIGYDKICLVCGEILDEDVEQKRTTEKHTFDANGICSTAYGKKGCGYAKDCQHKDKTKEYDEDKTIYKCIDENKHRVTYYYHYICNTCGQRIDDDYYYERETESHTFKNNECKYCGYVRVEELDATVTVSSTSVVVGDYVSVEVTAVGGAGGYKYVYYVYINDVEVASTPDANEEWGYDAIEAGEMYFKVIVTDSDSEQITVYSDTVTISPDENETPEIESIQIYSPAEGDYIDWLNPPDLTWENLDTATSYVVTLYDEAGNCISTNPCDDNVFQLKDKLPSPASYYRVEVYAYNSKGNKVGYGQSYFYTDAEKPIVATGGVQNISDDSVKLTMNIISVGGSSITKKGFYFGSDVDNLTEQSTLVETTSEWQYTSTIDGLKPNIQYYYQAFASNEYGEGVGAIYSFMTNDEGSLLVSPSEFVFAGNADSDTISVNSGSEWTVTVENGADWITTGRKYGYLNKNFTVSVKENNTGEVRNGTIKIEDKTGSAYISVQQNSDVSSTLSVNTQNFTVDSGRNIIDNINITSNDAWEVSSKVSWIVPSVNTGRFDDSISLIVEENTTSAARSGQMLITCGDVVCTLTITQKASAKPMLSNFTSTYTVSTNEKFNIQGIVSASDSGKLNRITVKLAGNDESIVSVLANGAETYNLSQLAQFDTAMKPINNQVGTYTYVIYASADNFTSTENEIGRFTVNVVKKAATEAKVSLFNTAVNTTSLMIKGKIDTLGDSSFEECGVILYDAEKNQLETKKTLEYPANNSKTFTAEFTGLIPNVNYYAKCYLTAGGKTYYYPEGSGYISLTTTQCVALTGLTIDPYGAYITANSVENGVKAQKDKEFTFTLTPTPGNAYVTNYSFSHNGGSSVSYTQEDNTYKFTVNKTGSFVFTVKAENDVSSVEKSINVLITEDDGMVFFRFPSSSNGEISTGISMYYSDDLFYGSSYAGYNHDLAKAALGLAVAAYTADTTYYGAVPTEPGDNSYSDGNGTYADYEKRIANIAYAYEQMGIEEDNIKYMLYDESLNSVEDNVAYSIAKKITTVNEEQTTLIFVVLRGGGYGAEWASNFDVGISGDYSKAFNEASKIVYDHITQYINNLSSSQSENIKVLITGYSRSAAVANLTAAKLNEWAMNNSRLQPLDIFAYTFATPNTVLESCVENKLNRYGSIFYDNIHNIVNPSDAVPKVPLTQWGFTKFGNIHYFDSYIDGSTFDRVDDMFDSINIEGSTLESDSAKIYKHISSANLLGEMLNNITSENGGNGRANFYKTLKLPIQKCLHIMNYKKPLTTDPDVFLDSDIMSYLFDYYPSDKTTIQKLYADGGYADTNFKMFIDILNSQLDNVYVKLLATVGDITWSLYDEDVNTPLNELYDNYESLCKTIQDYLYEHESIVKGILVIYYLEYGNDDFHSVDEWMTMLITGGLKTLLKHPIKTIKFFSEYLKNFIVGTSHTPELYLAWMNAFSSTEMKCMFKLINISKTIQVACPVDVYFYDQEGTVAASIIGGTVTNNTEDINIKVTDDVKSIQMSEQADYRIEIIPVAEGDMNVSVAFEDVCGTETEKYYFNDVTLDASLEYELIATEDGDGNIVYQLLDSKQSTVSDDTIINGKIQTIRTQVDVVGNGKVIYEEYVSPDTYVTLIAIPESDDAFIGWYLNEELVGIEQTYSFFASQSQTYIAKFTQSGDNNETNAYTITGTVTSSDSNTKSTDDDTVTITLANDDNTYQTTVISAGINNTVEYSIENVVPGTYTMTVSKSKHATREYTVTVVSEDVVQNAIIRLYGDVTDDGYVNMTDVTQIKRYCSGKTSIFGTADTDTEEYRLVVANVYTDDGVINMTDVTQIKRYCSGKTSIFDYLP